MGVENGENEDEDDVSESTSIPLLPPGGNVKYSLSSSSLSSLSSSLVVKTINLEEFSGYEQLREHLLELASSSTLATTSEEAGGEISVVYWTAHNAAHQIALGGPYEFFKAQCVKLHAKVYPNANGRASAFRSIRFLSRRDYRRHLPPSSMMFKQNARLYHHHCKQQTTSININTLPYG